MKTRILALESRITQLEKLLVTSESYDDKLREDVAIAIADWVRLIWNKDPLFAAFALAYINGEDKGDWIMDKCLNALEDQGFIFDNEDTDYISDCLTAEVAAIAEADESLKRRVKHKKKTSS